MVSERHRSYAAAVVMDEEAGEGTSTRQTAAPPTSGGRNSENQNPVQRNEEFDDPMYIHITENPNLILVSPPLSECNYASWSRSMKIALGVKNKLGFVNGTILCPDESDPKYPVWMRCNDIVCSWILKSLSSTIAESVLYFENAADIWNALRQRYSQADLIHMDVWGPFAVASLKGEHYFLTIVDDHSRFTWLINRLPSPTISGNSPFEILFGKTVDYDQLKTFGCLCFGATASQGRSKMQPRARKCIFLGFPFQRNLFKGKL